MTKQMDVVGVHIGTQQQHGTTGVEGPDRDVLGLNAEMVATGLGRLTKSHGQVSWHDGPPDVAVRSISIERGEG